MKDAVIVAAVRSPMGRANKGQFVWTRIDDLGGEVIRAALAKVPQVNPAEIEDVIIGCAMPEGEQGMNVARNVGFLAGIPYEPAAVTVNRFCSSSLQTVMMAAQAIQSGNGEVFVTAGIESMTHVPMGGFNPSLNPRLVQKDMPEAYISMGITAENLAAKYRVSRSEQDEFAVASHEKAIAAMKTGLFKDEIIAVTATGQDGKRSLVDTDEGPRPGTTVAKLGELKPAFKADGTVTAGNSSPLTDGAAAVIVMSSEKAKQLGIKPLARIVSMAVAGCDPSIMGIGPVPAVGKALKRAGLRLGDIGIIELNEAFAAQSIAVLQQLERDHGVKIDRVKQLNPKGGAIALGHPLGCSGARIMATLLSDLHQYDKKYGLETMCVGGGQGAAMILEKLS